MRIVGGAARGRVLKAVPGSSTRPTADRVRQSLFDLLGQRCDGLAVLDLYAGTGALALEALSRGARFALMVDDGTEARALIRENVEALGAGGQTRILRRDARKLGEAPPGEPYSLAFLDPPYGRGLAGGTLEALRTGQWLLPGALVVVEEGAEAAFAAPPGYETLETRGFGDTQLVFLRAG